MTDWAFLCKADLRFKPEVSKAGGTCRLDGSEGVTGDHPPDRKWRRAYAGPRVFQPVRQDRG